MWRFIVTAVGVALIATFGALKNTWAGFNYFALVFTCLLCLYWIISLSIDYYYKFIKVDEQEFKLYKAQLVNYKNIPLSDIELNEKLYIKKFKKSQRKDKLIEIGKILFLLGIFIGCIFIFI